MEIVRIANLYSSGGVGYYVHRAQRNVCRSMRYEWLDWRGTAEELESFQPDLVIMDVGRKDVYVPRGVPIAMIVSQWTDEPIWPQLYDRGYYTRGPDIAFVEEVDPTALYHHCTPGGIDQGFKFWMDRCGRRVHSVPLFADFSYFYREISETSDYDVCYVGGRWPYKAQVIDKFLLPTLQDRSISSVVYGNRGWHDVPNINFKGVLPDDGEADLYNRTKVVPCCHEPHSHYGFDVVIRVYTPLLSGAAVVTDPNPSIYGEEFFTGDEIMVCGDVEGYADTVRYLLQNDDVRRTLIAKGQRRVARDYTMEENVSLMLDATGFHQEAFDVRTFARDRFERIFGSEES